MRPSPECNNHGYFYNNQCFCSIQYIGDKCEFKNSQFWKEAKNRCNELVNRIDFLFNIDSEHYQGDDEQFSRLYGDSIGKPKPDQDLRVPNEWIQMHNLTKKFSIFGELGISPKDIRQGGLGNCYFLAALGSLANVRNGKPIRQAFLTNEDNQNHVFITQWVINGKPRLVAVDDWIPAFGNRPAFSTYIGDHDFWGVILEKAWAKIHGDYMATQNGKTTKIWETLTSARTFEFFHIKSEPNIIYKHIKKILNKNFPVSTATVLNREKNLIQNHAYSVLKAYEVQIEGNQIQKLIQVFNPWNQEMWKENPWSDTSENWKKVTNKSIDINKFDGAFHLTPEDYTYEFGFSSWAEIYNDYDIVWHDIPFTIKDQMHSVKFSAKGLEGKNFYIFVDLVSERILQKQKCLKPFQYYKKSLRIYTPDLKIIKEDINIPQVKIKKAVDGIYEVFIRIIQNFDYHKYFTISVYAPKNSINFQIKEEQKPKDKKKNCKQDCSKNGVCNTSTGECICYEGWEGQICSQKSILKCPNNCNNKGICDQMYGSCKCNQGFTGADCQPCQDKEKDCDYWTKKGYCEEDGPYSKFMLENCQKSCGQAGYLHFESCSIKIQKDECDGINCGKNGKCEKGFCVCDNGYEGLFCQIKENVFCIDVFGKSCKKKYKKNECFNKWNVFMKMGCAKTCGFC